VRNLKLFLIPLLTLLIFTAEATNAYALDLWPFNDLWNSVKCVADIDCTIQTASTAAGNFIVHVAVDKDFEELKEYDVQSMIDGTWDKGLASAVGKTGGLAYNFPPVHFGDYIKTELADNLLNNPVQAQSVGTEALSPIQEIWTRMRDVAYGLFAIVMVALGIMIIFQKEISPRVVVTFTNALPKILTGLILITFSYPIIALIIDAGAVFGSQLVLTAVSGIFEGTGTVTGSGASAAISSVPTVIIGGFLEGMAAFGIGPLAALITTVIFLLAALVLAGLMIIRVVISYGYLIVYTIFSPILLLFGTLPGQEGSVANLFKNILSKTLVFPAVLFFALLGVYFIKATWEGVASNFFEGNFGNVISGAVTTQGILGAILALLMLVAAFKAPSLIDNAIGVGKTKK
jgi:hypothetical protein